MNIQSAKDKLADIGEVEKNKALLTIGDVINVGGENIEILGIFDSGIEFMAWDGELDCMGWVKDSYLKKIKNAEQAMYLNDYNTIDPKWLTFEEKQAFNW